MKKYVEEVINEMFVNDEEFAEDLNILSIGEYNELKKIAFDELTDNVEKLQKKIKDNVHVGVKCWECIQNYKGEVVSEYEVGDIQELNVVKKVEKGGTKIVANQEFTELTLTLKNNKRIMVYGTKNFKLKDFK